MQFTAATYVTLLILNSIKNYFLSNFPILKCVYPCDSNSKKVAIIVPGQCQFVAYQTGLLCTLIQHSKYRTRKDVWNRVVFRGFSSGSISGFLASVTAELPGVMTSELILNKLIIPFYDKVKSGINPGMNLSYSYIQDLLTVLIASTGPLERFPNIFTRLCIMSTRLDRPNKIMTTESFKTTVTTYIDDIKASINLPGVVTSLSKKGFIHTNGNEYVDSFIADAYSPIIGSDCAGRVICTATASAYKEIGMPNVNLCEFDTEKCPVIYASGGVYDILGSSDDREGFAEYGYLMFSSKSDPVLLFNHGVSVANRFQTSFDELLTKALKL